LDAATANIARSAQLAEILGKNWKLQMREAAKKFEFEKAAQLRTGYGR